MAQYIVYINYTATETIEVEADSRDAAVLAAYEQSNPTLCHQCAGHLDLGDPTGELVTDAVTGDEIPEGGD